MKSKLRFILFVLLLTPLLSADIGFSVQSAVKNFPQIIVLNTETGCSANYFAPPGLWRVRDAEGNPVFSGTEGAAMNALIFLCP